MSVIWEVDDGEATLRLRHTAELGFFFEHSESEERVDVELKDLAHLRDQISRQISKLIK